MKTYKLAHFHSSLGVYGAERWTFTQLRHLNKSLFSTTVITIGTKPGATAFCEFLQKNGMSTHHIDLPGKLNPKAILSLRRYLAQNRIDILHTHGFKSDILGLLACIGLPVKLVTTLHGWSADENLRIRIYEWIGRLFLKGFQRIYPLSPALLAGLKAQGHPDDRLKLVLNAVDIEPFDQQFQNRRSRAKTDPLNIVFVGRLCRPKGVFDLLNGFAKARFDCPATLTIAGDGPEREEMEAICANLGISDRVNFAGVVDPILPVLEKADVLVLPSYSEGIPRTVMEAFAAGVPVVGTAITGVETLVKNGSTGLTVPVADADALAAAFERLANEPEYAANLARAARRFIEEHHSASRQAREFEADYLALLDVPPSAADAVAAGPAQPS